MSTLDKKEIIEALENKELIFTPQIDGWQVQPNSVDLRVGFDFYIPKSWEYNEKGRTAIKVDYMDYENKQEGFQMIKLKAGQYFEILPREHILISTLEKITLNSDDLMAILYARTSVMRKGLLVGEGVVDIKYTGHLVIPMTNNTDNQVIRVYPGERVCQLVFHKTGRGLSDEEALKHGLYTAKYHGSTSQNLDSRHDKSEEIDLIRDGKLDELKSKYSIKTLK